MAAKLFFEHEPSCSYCLYSKRVGDSFHCGRTGRAEAAGKCRRFIYYPFARVPRQQPRLKSYIEDDFKL